MRLAIFTESLPPNTDGVQKTMSFLADSLMEDKVDFKFFSPVKPESGFSWVDRVRKVSSVPFFLYKEYKVGLPYFDNLDYDLDFLNPELVHICAPSLMGLYALNYAKRRNIPVVSSYHTNWIQYFPYFGLNGFENYGWAFLKWFHSKSLRNYVPTPSTITMLNEHGINNTELWQRGIELDKFSPDLRSMELRRSIGAGDKPVLLFVGRLINHKDLDDLVVAHNMLKEKYDYKLVLVGDGPMRQELEQKMPDAHYTGYQKGRSLYEWYASADMFVFPSTTETFGNVILEAFASGIPAIGAAQGGVGDVINHELDGYLARPRDPVDFAVYMEKLLADPALRIKLGKQARQTAKKYSWSAINQKLITSYETVISEYYVRQPYPYSLAS